MTLTEIAATYNEAEIQKLHNFLMKNYQGKLTGKKSPVDVAIEIMRGRESELNKNQKMLFEGLKTIDYAVMAVDQANGVIKDMTPRQIDEVINKFSDEIIEFDSKELLQGLDDCMAYGEQLISALESKLQEGE